MNRKLNRKTTIFLIVFVLWLFFIFFVWRKFNPETSTRNFVVTTKGLNHFRKGLDVSGGTKLIYKISYDKYEQVYEGAELIAVKKMIEDIILSNIDQRISWLGVSDYRAYVQNMNNNPYIVVEIWGIADLDQAKEIIGKTVELEFRLPNEIEPDANTKNLRKQLAEDLRNDILQADGAIDKFASNRWSENIFYDHWTGVTLAQLPDIYREKISLTEDKIWQISELVQGTYDISSYNDMSGNLQNVELYGNTFYRLNEVSSSSRESVTPNDIVEVAEELWYSYDTLVEKDPIVDMDTYDYIDNQLVYNLGDIAKGEAAYDVKVVQIVSNNLIAMWTWEDDLQLEEEKNQTIENVKSTIMLSDSFDWANLLANDWIQEDQLKSIISNFDPSDTEQVQTYTDINNTYVLYIKDRKSANEELYSVLSVNNVNQESFEDKLSSKVLYDIESVFVQDRETWLTAKSNDGEILNGAYFKYANTSQSQVGLPVVAINFDDKGKEIFCNITSDNIGTQMAIFVWWELKTSPVIRSKICGGVAQIDGSFTVESAKQLVDDLNDGALPAPLVLMQEDKIDPTLWANALNWALISALVGILIIFAYMWFMYGWRKAVVTLSVLVSFMVILWFFMKLVDYAMSLSGIAAVVLSIWMAVDANILIYERIQEEKTKWKTVNSVIETAYDRSRPAIRDGNISTGLIALLLFMLGSNMFKWFGTMLIVTVLLTLFVNVPLTKALLKLIHDKE